LKEYELNQNQKELWNILTEFKRLNFYMGCGSNENIVTDSDKPDDNGIYPGHAYAILKVEELDGHRLLQLRSK
jgi:hypothetical protein